MLDWIGLNISGLLNPDISIQARLIQVWINPILLNPKFGGPPHIWVQRGRGVGFNFGDPNLEKKRLRYFKGYFKLCLYFVDWLPFPILAIQYNQGCQNYEG